MSKLIIPQFNMDDETNAQCLLVWAELVSSFNTLNDLPDQNRLEICKSLIHLLDDKIEKQTAQSYIGNPVVPATVAITTVDVAPAEEKTDDKPVEETPPPVADKPEEEESTEEEPSEDETDDEDEDAKGDDVKDAVDKVEAASGKDEEDEEEDDEYYESVASCRLSADPLKMKKVAGKGITLMVEGLSVSKGIATFKIGSKEFKTPVENGKLAVNVFVENTKIAGNVKLEKAIGPAYLAVGKDASLSLK